jgi:hypothetical protein
MEEEGVDEKKSGVVLVLRALRWAETWWRTISTWHAAFASFHHCQPPGRFFSPRTSSGVRRTGSLLGSCPALRDHGAHCNRPPAVACRYCRHPPPCTRDLLLQPCNGMHPRCLLLVRYTCSASHECEYTSSLGLLLRCELLGWSSLRLNLFYI